MVAGIAEVVIELAAIIAGVGGVTLLACFIALVWWEHREELAFLDDYRRDRAARRASVPEPAHAMIMRTPAPAAAPSRSLQHHP